MKQLQFTLLMLAIILVTACKKTKTPANEPYTCTTCKTAPDAKAANDASSKGIYKGVVIGSSGTITFDIANNGTAITSVMIIDGITVNLTSAVTWVAGQAYVADFTGVLSGSPVTIRFSVGLSGATPTVTSSTIPGHPNASLTIVKETSTGLVECFEGTYSTTLPETGTLNIILSRTLSSWSAVARKTGTTASGTVGNGTIVNNKLIDPAQNNNSIGTINADKIDGSFVDGNGKTVTVTCKRTL
ncbi:MAG: hypothetical protein ABL872_07380 [Lacibacter sp.]